MSTPHEFTRDSLDWLPWLSPIAPENLSERQRQALVDKAREKSAYFTLLARDPDILEARTKLDNDIFHNTRDGLPRGERELAAAATSRFNGCIYCASVHARFAAQFLKNTEAVDKLLREGTRARINARWDAIIDAASALSKTPPHLTETHISELKKVGMDEDDISDLIQSVSFFNWANRLMLSLGEPDQP